MLFHFFACFITVLPQAARAKYHKLGGLASIYFSQFWRLVVWIRMQHGQVRTLFWVTGCLPLILSSHGGKRESSGPFIA